MFDTRVRLLICLVVLAIVAGPTAADKLLVYKADFNGSGVVGEGTSYYGGVTGANGHGWDAWDTDVMSGTTGRAFGRWGKGRALGNTRVLDLSGLPAHTGITVKFDLRIAGMEGNIWDGNGNASDTAPDKFVVTAISESGNVTLLDTTFSQDAGVAQSFPGPYPSSNPGLTGSSSTTGTTHIASVWTGISAGGAHTDSAVQIHFEPNQSQTNEDWWIDNVEVWVTVPPITTGMRIYQADFDGAGAVGEGVKLFSGVTGKNGHGWDAWDSDVVSGTTGRAFGRWGKGRALGNTRVLELGDLPSHAVVSVKFDVRTAGISGNLWDGNGIAGDTNPDLFTVKFATADGEMIAMNTTLSQDAAVTQSYPDSYYGVNAGLTGSASSGGTTHITTIWRGLSASIPHSARTLKVYFSPNQTKVDEDWWLDNVEVWVSVPPLRGGSTQVYWGDFNGATAPGSGCEFFSGATPPAGNVNGGWDAWDLDGAGGNQYIFGRWGMGRALGNTRYLEITNLPLHTGIRVHFNLGVAGLSTEGRPANVWDGNGTAGDIDPDLFVVEMDAGSEDVTLLKTTLSQNAGIAQSYPEPYGSTYPGLTGIASTGGSPHISTWWNNIMVVAPHTSDSVRVYFRPNQTQVDEDWWLDNVAVWVGRLNADPTPVEISEIKSVVDGTLVTLPTATVAASVMGEFGAQHSFSVEEINRSSGIRVYEDGVTARIPGDVVTVVVTVITANGEKVIDATAPRNGWVEYLDAGTAPQPLGMTNRAMGGGASDGQGAVANDATAGPVMAVGSNNVGMLVTTWGRVTYVNNVTTFGDCYFYIDDGSGIQDGSGQIGIRCWPGVDSWGYAKLPAQGSYVSVTGVSGVQQIGGINSRFLWTTSWQEVEE